MRNMMMGKFCSITILKLGCIWYQGIPLIWYPPDLHPNLRIVIQGDFDGNMADLSLTWKCWICHSGDFPRWANILGFASQKEYVFIKNPWRTIILREPQHTPGAYPRHPQTPKWKEFLHKLLVGGLGYAPGVCWKVLRIMTGWRIPIFYIWAVLSDEQMSKWWPFSLLNDEQMSNWLGVEHQPDRKYMEIHLQVVGFPLPC